MTRLPRTLTLLTAWLLSIALVLGVAPARLLAGHAPAVDDDGPAVARIADYTAERQVDRLLERHGAPVDGSWRGMPAIRKIAVARDAAEAFEAGSGERFLSLLARDLAQQHTAAKSDPEFEKYLKGPEPRPITGFDFGPGPELPDPKPDAATKAAISKIAQYTDHNARHNPRAVLMTHFGLSGADADSLLLRSKTYAEAYEQALSRTTDRAKQKGIIAAIVARLQTSYTAAKHEPDFKPFSGGVDPPSPPPRSNTSRYKSFVKSSYPTSSARSFRRMSFRAGGFGGVVVGNDIAAPTVKPRSYAFEARPKGGGDIVVETAAGRELRYGPLTQETFAVAHNIVVPTVSGVRAPRSGEGVGLVALRRVALSTCDVERLEVRNSTAPRFEVVLHPALDDTRLGRHVLFVDAAPINGKLALGDATAEEKPELARLFEDMGGTWKLFDAATQIEAGFGRLSVVADGCTEGDCSGVLALHVFNALSAPDSADPMLAFRFREALPEVLAASPEYRSVNELLRATSLIRWLVSNEARLTGDLPAVPVESTPDAVMVRDGKIAEVDLGDALAAEVASRAEETKCRRQIEKSSKAVRRAKALLPVYQRALRAHHDALATTWTSGSVVDTKRLEKVSAELAKHERVLDELIRLPEVRFWLEVRTLDPSQ